MGLNWEHMFVKGRCVIYSKSYEYESCAKMRSEKRRGQYIIIFFSQSALCIVIRSNKRASLFSELDSALLTKRTENMIE